MRRVLGLGLGLGLGFCLLSLLVLTVSGEEEALQLLHLHSIAVPVSPSDLRPVSTSVVAAEAWLKAHVLSRYPSANISTIVVGRGILCSAEHEGMWILVLPSVKNLYYSLVRWGLAREIKVSAAFSDHCLESTSFHSNLRPLLSFIQDTSSAYIYDGASRSSDHRTALARMGYSAIRDIRVIGEVELKSRRLSASSFPSLPELPKSSPVLAPPPAAANGLPPPLQFAPVPDSSFSFAPDSSPDFIPGGPSSPVAAPGSPPYALVFPSPPPCSAAAPSPAPEARGRQELWCVAKPAVPTEKLQEAMDYACGEGGADCKEIMPNGNCYFPDNLVAHASFAFNSYWQKTKERGGSCSFDGTALLINSDPSFQQCKFVLG